MGGRGTGCSCRDDLPLLPAAVLIVGVTVAGCASGEGSSRSLFLPPLGLHQGSPSEDTALLPQRLWGHGVPLFQSWSHLFVNWGFSFPLRQQSEKQREGGA